ncbi:MAG: DegT/DnrJ/EryC1/StrS family aminotransferase [Candidatus Acidiferrales bacterium]
MKSGAISLGPSIGDDTPRHRTFAPWPHFEEEELQAAAAVLRSGKVNYWTGEEGRLFEREFAAFTGTRHAVALANGTVALESALFALGICPGDEVIVPSRTFIASASCAAMRGAVPVCVDVDRESQTLTVETIRPALSHRTKAIIAVHLAGWPCDMDSILSLARPLGIKVIEDCAQALGATYKHRPVGSLGDAAAFSFCQDKILTTGGEGGMITTNDEEVWNRAWSFKDHGKSYQATDHSQHPAKFRWLHDSFGTNWRLTEMQSAIGRVLLRKLPQMVTKRRALANILTNAFSRNPALRITPPPDDIGHSYYKYYAFVRPERLADGWNRDRIMVAVSAQGIPCFSGSCSEIYLEEAFPDHMRPAERLKVARELAETSLMFLVHPTLGSEDMEDTCSVVEKVTRAAAK